MATPMTSGSLARPGPFALLARHVTRHAVRYSVIGACAVLVACFVAMSWQPLSTDDLDFWRAAADWYRYRQLIPHPQLFVHFIQLLMALLGQTIFAARLAALIPILLTVVLLPQLVRLVYRDTGRGPGRDSLSPTRIQTIAILAVWLFALNPYTIQNTVLLDTDSSALPFTMVLMLCLWFTLANAPAWKRILALSLGFMFCLWFKVTTPPMLIVALAAYCVLRGCWRDLLIVAAFTVLGTALFVGLHSIYSAFTGFTLQAAFSGWGWRSGGFGSLRSLLDLAPQGLGIFLLWLTPPLVILAALAALESAGRLLRRRLREEDLLVIFALGVTLAYSILIAPAWGYPRYHAPAVPFIMVLVAAFAVRRIESPARGARATFALLAACAALTVLYLLPVVGDPLYDLYRATFETTQLSARLRIGGLAVLKLLPPLIVAIPFALGAAARLRASRTGMLVAVLAALAFGYGVETALVQVTADYSTRFRYTYVYADRWRADARVLQTVPADGYIVSDKDVLIDTGRTGEEIYAHMAGAPQAFIELLHSRRIDALVWTEKEWMKATPISGDAALSALLSRCYDQQQYGIFVVLTRNQSRTCELP
jgi:hypothetical protein